MSVVSNVILSFCILEDEHERLKEVNQYFEQEGTTEARGTRFLEPLSYGGTKYLEQPTHLAAINYLSVGSFLDWLTTVKWEYPENVQCFICGQEDDVYTEYRVHNK